MNSIRCMLTVAFVLAGWAIATAAQQQSEVLILAASSTTDAVDAIRNRFQELHPEIEVRTSFGASSALAQQIAAGAEADLFLSASPEWTEMLVADGLVARRHDLLGNRLVVVVPASSTLELHRPEDLLQAGIRRLALADTASVPAGVYAREALEHLHLWKELEPRVASAANVRQALQFVATAAAEAGIVYASDAVAEPQVRVALELAPQLSTPIRYPLALLKGAKGNSAAVTFFEFLSSSDAATIFRQNGFVLLSNAQTGEGNVDDEQPGKPSAWWALTRDEWLALGLSFRVGLFAVLVSLPIATGVGYFLARSNTRGLWLVELVVNLPLVLPPVVTGLLLLKLFAPGGPIGGALERTLGLRIVFTWWGAALAAAVVSFPLMVRAIRLAFQAVDPRLEMAARSLGAGRWDAFWSVSLPLARRGLLAGCVLAFARSLGEFGATIMVAGNIVGQTQTIPLAIFSDSNRPGAEYQVWRLVCISIVLAAGALAGSEWLERRHAARDSA